MNETAESGGDLVNPLAVIDMKSKLRNNSSSNENVNKSITMTEFTKSNLTNIEDKLIKGLINREVVAESSSEVKPAISLDDAVKRIKNGR